MNARDKPTAITGTWSDLESLAEYVYFDEGVPGTSLYTLAEAVIVLLGVGSQAVLEAERDTALHALEIAWSDFYLIAGPHIPDRQRKQHARESMERVRVAIAVAAAGEPRK